ncbi:MAG: type II toxin-antitoxin system Phd/YefM family antitoxin [Lentisphaerae bacterium]|jgi:prevent-host-death family protein|nr:type II toxin-antitoxin system Phd/YefM family antitoxin [Lentisphaerota bacterium]MBT5604867.1 type II toxin-antitoxin system Phd/YefM family antitoxin [Lentisphaerota bacterium]MBT7054214.1 type II toxin-antitoxin system Phd/YefM family antitoxin [Lentisphaerota bacterium]MBT7841011.1 type II toxin-antitoxin system Phd/YefM family antitoxin [Lentisphaerota bacterium]
MKTMAITDFKAHALQVLAEVAARKERVLVTKHGKPLAEVVPYTETKPTPGRLAEALVFQEDIVSPLGEEMWDACR